MATRRGYFREELKRSTDNIDMCLTHLDRVIEAYSKDYPEVSTAVIQLGEVLITVRDAIIEIRERI